MTKVFIPGSNEDLLTVLGLAETSPTPGYYIVSMNLSTDEDIVDINCRLQRLGKYPHVTITSPDKFLESPFNMGKCVIVVDCEPSIVHGMWLNKLLWFNDVYMVVTRMGSDTSTEDSSVSSTLTLDVDTLTSPAIMEYCSDTGKLLKDVLIEEYDKMVMQKQQGELAKKESKIYPSLALTMSKISKPMCGDLINSVVEISSPAQMYMDASEGRKAVIVQKTVDRVETLETQMGMMSLIQNIIDKKIELNKAQQYLIDARREMSQFMESHDITEFEQILNEYCK